MKKNDTLYGVFYDVKKCPHCKKKIGMSIIKMHGDDNYYEVEVSK